MRLAFRTERPPHDMVAEKHLRLSAPALMHTVSDRILKGDCRALVPSSMHPVLHYCPTRDEGDKLPRNCRECGASRVGDTLENIRISTPISLLSSRAETFQLSVPTWSRKMRSFLSFRFNIPRAPTNSVVWLSHWRTPPRAPQTIATHKHRRSIRKYYILVLSILFVFRLDYTTGFQPCLSFHLALVNHGTV
jgi:hypothetical protein